MPSSTSSSEPGPAGRAGAEPAPTSRAGADPDPAGRAGALRALALAAALFAGGVAGLEGCWRARGHVPSVVDDLALWAQERDRVDGEATLALLGASRMLLDLSLPALRRALPGREPVQLAVGGAWPVAALRDLAADPAFRGTAIVSLTAEALEVEHRDDQQPQVDYYHREWRPERRLARRLRTALQTRLVAVNPRVGLASLGRELWDSGALPEPYFLVTRADRSKSADFGRVDFTRNRRAGERVVREHYRRARISSPAAWLAGAEPVWDHVRRIEARGGRVAFVRLPTGGVHWQEEQRHYPRTRYWDAFAARTPAVALHFRDAPTLLAFEPPDASHLDGRDAPAFTRALVAELARQGLFEPRG